MTPYCGACGEPFQSQGLFDEHRVGSYDRAGEDRVVKGKRVGPRRCLTRDEMLAKGWRHDGRTWRGPKREGGWR